MKSNTSYLARLFGYVSSSIPYFLISFFGFVLFAAAQVGAAEWLRRIVDFIENPNQTVQTILPLALIAIALVRGIGFYLSNFFMAFISNKLIHNLRVDLFKSLISMPVSFYDKSSSGHLLSRITFNVMQVSSAVTDAVKIIIREGLIVIGLLGYLIYLNWKLTLVLIIAAPLIGFIVSIAGKRLRRLSKKIQSAMGDVTHVSSESINAHKELKIFGNENLEIDKFNEASDANRIQNLKLESTNSIASPLIQLIISLALALITWFALDPSVITSMSSGTFIAFFGSAGMLAKPIRQLSSTNVMFQKGIAAAEDIFKQIDETPEKDDGSKKIKNSEGKIKFDNVSLKYPSSEEYSLKNINFELEKGSNLAIVGSSGAGKSSIINLIPRFYDATEGGISIDGTRIEELSLESLRDQISYVGQEITLFNDTIFNNIFYGDIDTSEEDVYEAAKKANAHQFIESFPDGYKTVIGDNGTLLSGGQKQRIAIARAILKNSPFLILDEATSALDSESERLITDAIANLKEGKTTITIAHRLSTVEQADEILVLQSGEIVERGKHSQLILSEGPYFQLYRNQFDFDDGAVNIDAESNSNLLVNIDASKSYVSNLEQAWYENSLWPKLLIPFSWIYQFLFNRQKRYQISNSWKPNLLTIVVGNLTVGGTGKTPIIIYLAKLLKKQGLKPGIISRGYLSKSKTYPLLLNSETPIEESGDEPAIMFKNSQCPVVIGPNRIQAAKHLMENTDSNVILSDDGLQHFSLGRDIEILMIDGNRKFGNELLLPAGPLREPKSRIKTVDFTISSNRKWPSVAKYEMKYRPFKWVHMKSQKEYEIFDWPLKKEVNAVAGIGNPSNFFNLLKQLGFEISEYAFPDHHDFHSVDFEIMDNQPTVMTEKDAIKCSFLDHTNYWYLKIEAEVSDNFEQDFLAEIKSK